MNCMWQFALPWDILKGGNEERGQHLGCNAFLNKVGQGMKIGFLAGTGVFVSIIQKDFRWALFCVCNLSCQFWGDWKCGTVFHFVLSVTTVGGSLVIVEVGREIGFKWVSALVCIPLLHAEKESETINKSWFYWVFLYFVIFCQYGRLNLLWSSWHIQTEQSFFFILFAHMVSVSCPYGDCISLYLCECPNTGYVLRYRLNWWWELDHLVAQRASVHLQTGFRHSFICFSP